MEIIDEHSMATRVLSSSASGRLVRSGPRFGWNDGVNAVADGKRWTKAVAFRHRAKERNERTVRVMSL